ncbi:MAG: DUF2442 domain-containing protein [Opitutales bacterium]|nr:DUF2442 domain-containing protein [Opitutales bacterium]
MNTATVSTEPLAIDAWVENRIVYLRLADQRIFGFPASRFSRLKNAPDHLLEQVTIEVNGYALRWEELDEDITVPGVVAGHFQLPPEPDGAGNRYRAPR